MTGKQLRVVAAFLAAMATIQLWTRGVSGLFTGLFIYGLLAVAGILFVIAEVLAFQNRGRDPDIPPAEVTLDPAPVSNASPDWRGGPEGRRRRTLVVLCILAAVALLVVLAALIR